MSKDMIGASRHLSPTETGLEVHGTPSEQEWQDMGIALGRADKALQWLIGDWYNQVPWGDKKAACERVGLKYTDARDYGSVAAKFQMSERSDILDFGHHRKAASLPTTEERTEVLNLAAQENWTVNQVREEVNERKKSTAPDKVKKFSMGWQTGILNHSEYKEVIGSRQLADNKKKVEDAVGYPIPSIFHDEAEFNEFVADFDAKYAPDRFGAALLEKMAEAPEEALSKTAQAKVDRAVKAKFLEMDIQFQIDLQRELKEALAEERAVMKEEWERITDAKKELHARTSIQNVRKKQRANRELNEFLQGDEIKTIRSVLHPDREASRQVKTSALIAWRKLEDLLKRKYC